MKISEKWLREWVNPSVDATSLAAKLNMAGLECEAEPLASTLPAGVFVGKIVTAVPHPQADRLRVCEVDVGSAAADGGLQTIVCGAANARPGILVPAALPGARLPGGVEIKRAALRGVESAGMLCSASELGLAEKSEGLLELDLDAQPGTPIEVYLGLDDQLLNLELTPNRGDCLSIAGTARELAALYSLPLTSPALSPAAVTCDSVQTVVIDDPQGCAHYVGRVIRGIRSDARTPDWMRERLRRSGIRTIHSVVDITNYVMIELGQPMHGFDLAKLEGSICVRRARAGESLTLLNDQTIELHVDDLLITDARGPRVLAGIMGGSDSGVTAETTDIFLESACFDAVSIAHSGRRHKLLSDSRYRNERGVDPALQQRALERATALIQSICGGDAGPIVAAGAAKETGAVIQLRHSQVNRLLGCELGADEIETLLGRLNIQLEARGNGQWQATSPSYRTDLRIEADLVEEIGRLYGYDKIPARTYSASLAGFNPPETQSPTAIIAQRLLGRGYQEIVTYSFVDPTLRATLDPEATEIPLDNPIAETMAVMRTTLWSGLVSTWTYNRQRQQPRARLFEIGSVYRCTTGTQDIIETPKIGGLLAGQAFPEQWGQRPVRFFDFFDAKGDLQALNQAWQYVAAPHPALHPGQSAKIIDPQTGEVAGWLGTLHPKIAEKLDLPENVVLFELDLASLNRQLLPRGASVSEFPSSRRDLTVVVDEKIEADLLLNIVRSSGAENLSSAALFDIYRGPTIPNGCKSLTLGLIFQHGSRTLNIVEIDAAVAVITASINARLGASIRGEDS